MTLPFRRRHHDAESTHDRARALVSTEMVEPIPETDAEWLAGHLEACAECRRDREAYIEDRLLLRGLRVGAPDPPRDLWARTSAAIQREGGRGRRRPATGPSGSGATRSLWRGLPVGAAAAALIVVVVVGTSLVPRPEPPAGTPGPSGVAVVTPQVQPTPITLAAADPVGWIRQAANGRWELVISDLLEVCPRSRAGCEALGADDPGRTVDLGGVPTAVTISPDEAHLVVESRDAATELARVLAVPVPTSPAPATPAPPSDPAISPHPVGETPGPTPDGTPGSTPDGAIEIASGVTIVGDSGYSADGAWFAFSARPADDSSGPDLYLWRVGDPAGANAITDDHQTYFSTWLDGRVLASSVVFPAPLPGESADPDATPAASPSGTDDELEPAHPRSFLVDPATLVRAELAEPDVWLPVVDPTGRLTAYWSGTLLPAPDGLGWELAEGSLVLDGWLDPGASPSEAPEESAAASGVDRIGPAGNPVALDVGPIATFRAAFDPEGLRLAVWAADAVDSEVGRMHLVVLDPDTASVDASIAPLPGVQALRRFSIEVGRLAWVSPPGQDGQESAVQVLGWSGRDFGEVRTIPARDLLIVR